jgi:hypothetical protein
VTAQLDLTYRGQADHHSLSLTVRFDDEKKEK